MSLNQTPRSSRVHIAFFGKRNAGKSSLINALVGQEIAIVSEVLGTTTDPVFKSMEILPIGPCVIIDTAGLDDDSDLGKLRIEKTYEVLNKTVAFCQRWRLPWTIPKKKSYKKSGKKIPLAAKKADLHGITKEDVEDFTKATKIPACMSVQKQARVSRQASAQAAP